MWEEFKKFASRGNVVDLAVGVIIGAAFTAIVNSLVTDILMPPLGFILGRVDFSNFFFALSAEHYARLEDARAANIPVITYGQFINNVIRFLIEAFAVFLLVRGMNKLFKKHQEAAPPPAQEVLLTEIRDLLKAKQS
jgi:large conductance mechanosensitive channel